jgi:hypothetical protein
MERGGAMTEVTDAEVGEIDLAVVAYRDEGDWSLSELPVRWTPSPRSCGATPGTTERSH